MTTSVATASAGAAPAATSNPASSAQNTGSPATDAPRASYQERLQKRASELMQRPSPASQAPVAEDASPLEGEQQQEGDIDTQQAEAKQPEAEQDKKSRMIPEAAFKERLAREARKRESIQKELAAARLDLRKAQEASALLQRTLDEQSQARAEGVPYDPKDAEVLQLRLQEEARKVSERLMKQHEDELRQMQAELKAEARAEQLREDFSRQIDDALSAFPLVSRRDLIAEMKAEQAKARPAPTRQLAQRLHDRALEVARKLGMQTVQETPPSPSTARPAGQRSPTKLPNNVQGYQQFIESMQRR